MNTQPHTEPYDHAGRTQIGLPRSMWYGLEFLRYALSRIWFKDPNIRAYTRGYDSTVTFEAYLRNDLSASLQRRLRYYAKLRGAGPATPLDVGGEPVPIYGAWRMTLNDANFEFFCETLQDTAYAKGRSVRPEVTTAVGAAPESEAGGVLNVEHPSAALGREGFSLFVPGLSKVRSRDIKLQLRGGEM